MGDYFAAHPGETTIVWPAFSTWYMHTKSGKLPERDVTNLRLLLDRLEKGVPVEPVLDDVLAHFIAVDFATQVGSVAKKIAAGDDSVSMDDVMDLVKEYDHACNRAVSKDDLYASFTVSTLAAAVSSAGLEWPLEELNRSLGPARGGDFIVVAARPEVGKTTFVAQVIGYFARQLHAANNLRPILWINNEQQHDVVAFRILQATLGWPSSDILAAPAQAEAEFERLVGKGRIVLPRSDAGFNHIKYINPLLKEHRPAAVVFDQLDKVHSQHSSDDREDVVLGKKYQWAREVSHEFNAVVIAVSQLTAEAEGQLYPGQDLLRGSKTDKPGEADAIITIGYENSPAKMYERGINLPKNKLHGSSKTDPALRHGRFVVTIDPTIAQYRGTL